MAKFKAGDRVYCPEMDSWRTNEIGKGLIHTVFLYYDKLLVKLTEHHINQIEIIDEGTCPDFYAQRVFHATPENKKALETLYGMEFEEA